MNVKVLRRSEYEEQLIRVRKYCITKSPGFAGVALLPEYCIVDPKDPEFGSEYGFTDGRKIYLGTKLFKESPKAQAFVLIHEVLHVALRHPQRGLTLMKTRLLRGLPWSSEVYNWACDAIVNFSLENIMAWAHKPSVGLITFGSLFKHDPVLLTKKPAHQWGTEDLFRYLMDDVIMPKIKDGSIPSETVWAKDNLPGSGQNMLDIVTPQSGNVKPDSKEEARDWKGRVTRAAAGDRPGGVMKEILFDVPQTRTPWRYLLRQFLSEAVMPHTQVRPTRPSRASLTLDSFHKNTGSNSITPFMPGYRQKEGIRKIVVVVDTSGSIDDELCEYFAGEIQTIRKNVGCDLMLLTCDTEVHQAIPVSAYDNFQSIIKANGGFKGRGGTDFRPAVEAAEKIPGAAVIIYLTDMQGPYPDRCHVPLIWASIMENFIRPPCGKVVIVRKDDN